jgi:Armadillo/beta-catenin-like repeat
VQRAAAGALRTLAFKNEENKNLIVECQALPTLIQMLRSDDVGIHYEAVGVIGNLVHSSQHIKKTVLQASMFAVWYLISQHVHFRLVPCRGLLGMLQLVAACSPSVLGWKSL